MKQKFIIVYIIIVCFGIIFSCSRATSLSTFYPTHSEYLNNKGDGSITLRAHGLGKNRKDALEQALKNAVRDVIFTGVSVPGNLSLSRPLLNEINAQEKYEAFFNRFFKDGGEFTKFVNNSDARSDSNEIRWNATQTKLSTTVRVERAALKSFLQEQGIIKNNSQIK